MSADRATRLAARASRWARRHQRRYAGDEERPLGGYVATMAVYAAATGLASLAVRSSGRRLPERVGVADLALLSVACHKTSRLLSKDPVTSPLRAPVTEFEGQGGPSEVVEDVRGHGARHALGELVTCPFCIGQWTATAAMFGLVTAPRVTRFAAATMTVVAASDFLQLAYSAAQRRA